MNGPLALEMMGVQCPVGVALHTVGWKLGGTDCVCCLTSAAAGLGAETSPSGPPSAPDGVRFVKEDMGSYWHL